MQKNGIAGTIRVDLMIAGNEGAYRERVVFQYSGKYFPDNSTIHKVVSGYSQESATPPALRK